MITVGAVRTAKVDETTERLVRAHLKGMDPLLDLLWVPTVVRAKEGMDGRYALTCQWPETDKRWEMYHSGEIGEPFDIMGWFTEAAGRGDFHEPTSLPVDPSSILDRVVEFLGKCDNEREDWKVRMRRTMEHNQKQTQSVKALGAEEMLDHMMYNRHFIEGKPIIHLGGGDRRNITPRRR